MVDFQNQKVLFVTTKNLDYLRNTQEIEWIKQNCQSIKVIGSTKRSYFKRLLKVYFELLFCNMKQFDKVFVGFAPQLILPFFSWKMKRKEIIIDFFISMYDTLIFDRKKFSKKGIVAKILNHFDKKTIHLADLVIADTKAHGNYFIEEFGLEEQKLKVLYLKADEEIYHPMECEKPKSMQGKFTVLYFGSILPLQGLDIILETIDKMKNDENYYFLVIGPIQDKYIKPQSDNIEYHDWLSQEDLAKYISYSDLCLAGHFNKEIEKAKRTIPGKAYIYKAMDKPMVLGDNPATHELFSEDMSRIYFVEMGNAEALMETIQKAKVEIES